MADRIERALAQGINELGLDLSADEQEKLLHYLHLLVKWNKSFNLSGVTAIQDMVPLHLLDSLAVLPHCGYRKTSINPDRPARILDIGSGAGLPGIPLAITNPETKFVLLDSNGKKTRFLFQAKLALGLDNVEVVNARVDEYLTSTEDEFDLVTCRAFATLKVIVDMIPTLLMGGTKLLAMKGVYPQDEIDELDESVKIEEVIELVIPNIDSQRHLVLLSRAELS